MEHRFHPRRDLQAEVMLYHHGEAVAICTTRNISLGGMHIHTAPLRFCKNLPLEIELRPGSQNLLHLPAQGSTKRLAAFVVHHQADGTGLMFRQLPPWAHSVLHRLVLQLTEPPVWPHRITPASTDPAIVLLNRLDHPGQA